MPFAGVAPPVNDPAIPESALGARLGWRLGWGEAELRLQAEPVKKASRGGAEAAERSLAHETPIALQCSAASAPPRETVVFNLQCVVAGTGEEADGRQLHLRAP